MSEATSSRSRPSAGKIGMIAGLLAALSQPSNAQLPPGFTPPGPGEIDLFCPSNYTDGLWDKLFTMTMQGSDLFNEGKIDEAKVVLSSAIKEGTADITRAMKECSIGIASLYRTLAFCYCASKPDETPYGQRRGYQLGLRALHVAMDWTTWGFVKSGNSLEFVDYSSWPLTIQGINMELTTVQNLITQYGPHGHVPTLPDIPRNYRHPGLKIGIVTLCAYPSDHVLPNYSISNHDIYARYIPKTFSVLQHHLTFSIFKIVRRSKFIKDRFQFKHLFHKNSRWGYTTINGRDRLSPRPHAWGKIILMQQEMEKAEHDWLVWVDCDSYFMDLSTSTK